MRLFESVLAPFTHLQRPQRKFLIHLLRLLLMLPGHVTFRNFSRYSPYHERTFARHFATAVDFGRSTRPRVCGWSRRIMNRRWCSMPVLSLKAVSTRMASPTSGMAPRAARKSAGSVQEVLGHIAAVGSDVREHSLMEPRVHLWPNPPSAPPGSLALWPALCALPSCCRSRGASADRRWRSASSASAGSPPRAAPVARRHRRGRPPWAAAVQPESYSGSWARRWVARREWRRRPCCRCRVSLKCY